MLHYYVSMEFVVVLYLMPSARRGCFPERPELLSSRDLLVPAARAPTLHNTQSHQHNTTTTYIKTSMLRSTILTLSLSHLLTHSQSNNNSSVYSFTRSLTCSLACSLSCLINYSLNCSFICSLTHEFKQ